ncbi:hypothetical protein [uncultured Piscinibacter sp.]|uniref:hypothetical protein n=1 Tax=uncultured Piscinibacter sp. TaxID=1131835 RepID=UPI00260AD3E3|nr:hypothetical protein [uncultured Piscinibacter sp.]
MTARSPENDCADDHVLPVTRVVAACVVPFLLIAFASLYLRPDLSATHFAWRIAPNFTAYWLATGYLGGAWFFFRVTRVRRWHEVTLGFLPVTVFVWLMLLLTVLFWGRFDIHHFPFQLWLVLYVATPIVVPALWWRNRRHDPHRIEPGAIVVPATVRATMGVIGGALVLTALWMLVVPQAAIAAWAWKLTPLSACAMGGWLALSGVGGLVLAAEPRWSAWRVLIQSMLIWLALLTVGAWRAWEEFDPSRPAFVAVVAVPASLVGLGALYAAMERRRAAASGAPR